MIKRIVLWSAFPALVLAVLSFGLDAWLNPNLVSPNGLVGFATSNIAMIAASLAEAVLLVGGGLDLSVGATISMINVLVVVLFGLGLNSALVLLIGVLAALAIGALNGMLVVYLRINALLATFAVSFVSGGVALWLLPAPGGSVPMEFVNLIMGRAAGVSVALIGIVLLALAWMVLMRTTFMLQLFAVGGNRDKAFSSGVPVRRVRFNAYIVSSLFTAFAALSLTFSIGSGDPLIGQSYTLLAVAAPVVGGVAILGGSGDGLGAIFGAIFLATAAELLLGLGVSPFYQQFTVGLIILAGLAGVVVLQRHLADWRVRSAIALRRSGAAR